MYSLLGFITNTIRLYELLLIVRFFLSWVPHDRSNPFIDILCRVTDPVLNAAREVLSSIFRLFKVDPRNFPLDFSPILAFLFIEVVVKRLVVIIFRSLM
ncbi:MAG: YggT family protein [bacterium]